MDKVEEKVAEGVGIISVSNLPKLSGILEAAMSAAVMKCYADGIMDPDLQRAAMLEAREEAKKQYYALIESALEK